MIGFLINHTSIRFCTPETKLTCFFDAAGGVDMVLFRQAEKANLFRQGIELIEGTVEHAVLL